MTTTPDLCVCGNSPSNHRMLSHAYESDERNHPANWPDGAPWLKTTTDA